jgi:hypothetical protein
MAGYFIIFVCSGLLVYWFARTLLLLKESPEEIDEVLESDLWWGRRCLLALRMSFGPPTHLAG